MKDKRFNYVMPMEMFGDLQSIANDHGISVTDLLHRFNKLGIIASDLSRDPDGALIVRKGGKERRVILFPEDLDDQGTLYLG